MSWFESMINTLCKEIVSEVNVSGVETNSVERLCLEKSTVKSEEVNLDVGKANAL